MVTTQSVHGAARARTHDPAGTVVVGYDGGWRSRPALDRAAAEASARGLPLTVLCVVAAWDEDEPERRAGCSPEESSPEQEWRRATEQADAAVEELRHANPTLRVTPQVLLDSDDTGLRDRLSSGRLLVLGDRGRQEVSAFLLGSTSRQLLRAASCPVLVVPSGHPEAPRRSATPPRLPGGAAVLVGLGDGAEADRALRVAAEEALRRARPLHVLRSYEHLATVHGCDAVGAAWDEVQEHLARARLDAGLHVTVILTPDPPASALLQHGGLADLVVVGSRGSLALARLATGSVSRALLDAATWPLLVVPAA